MIAIQETAEFAEWLADLRDDVGKAKILSRIQRLGLGNPGDVAPLGEGISEMRIHFGPVTGCTTPQSQANTCCYAEAISGHSSQMLRRPRPPHASRGNQNDQ